MRDGAIVEALKRTSLPQCSPRCRTRFGPPRAHPIKEPVHFSLEDLIDHRRLKISSWKHLRKTRLLVILSSPLIYLCVLPFLLLDASVALYQLVCFPIYGIPKVPRKDYLVFDRGVLAYLNTIEKVGCVYCSYANGLLALITEIASRSRYSQGSQERLPGIRSGCVGLSEYHREGRMCLLLLCQRIACPDYGNRVADRAAFLSHQACPSIDSGTSSAASRV